MARFSMRVSMDLQYGANTVAEADARFESSCNICCNDFYRLNAECGRCGLEQVHKDRVEELSRVADKVVAMHTVRRAIG